MRKGAKHEKEMKGERMVAKEREGQREGRQAEREREKEQGREEVTERKEERERDRGSEAEARPACTYMR